MKVIFIKDVKGQGKKDDIKEVKTGFGEYLINSGVAVLYTNKSMEILAKEKEDRKEAANEIKSKATELKKSLEKITLKFKVKTGTNDKVFGNISSKQIGEELKKLGYDIDKKKIEISNPLNMLGIYKIKIILHKEVSAIISVELIK